MATSAPGAAPATWAAIEGAVLDLLYERPDARLDDVDEVHDRFLRTTGVPIVVTDGAVTRPATPEEVRRGPDPSRG